jgi:pre-mRNA-processing factor 39
MKDITHMYMVYLLERSVPGAIATYDLLDREINGPFSVQIQNRNRLANDGEVEVVESRLRLSNGHPGVEDNDNPANKDDLYEKYYKDQGGHDRLQLVAP